jgi:1,4-alpha-glucan branching enzyme
MRKFYLLVIATFLCINVTAQKVAVNPSITPSLFRYNDEITVTYDVTGTSLANLSSAYLWVWIPGKNTNAKYNINPATAGALTAKFDKIIADGKTTFSKTFIPQDFFTENISVETELGLLLKGTDWSNGQTTDFIADFWDGSFQVRINSPTQQPLFVSTLEEIEITAETPVNANYKLYVNDVLKSEQNDIKTFSYTHTVTETSGFGVVKITATSGGTTSEAFFQYLLTESSPEIARPAGVIEGINYSGDQTKVTLCVLAPGKSSVYVRGDFTDWLVLPEYLMNKDGELFWIEVSALTSGMEYGFQYLLDEDVYIADPYADKILDPDDQYIPSTVYPNLKTFPAQALSEKWYFNRVSVLQTNQQPYAWQVSDFEKPAKENLVVYELLVRDFFGAGSRSYKNLTDTISYFKGLGVNAIELMPIMEFNGNESWGYNPAFMFAPDKYFGPKNALKEFIDRCHQEGIAVILDIAMNHQDIPNPFLLTDFNFETSKPNPSNKWFNVNATHPFSVFFDMNHESLYTKAYLDTINHYWLDEYKVDGFRFDLSKGFTQKNNATDVNAWSAYDASRIAILKRMADEIWSHTPDAYVILEHLSANDEEKELAEYKADQGKGFMLWGNINGPFSQLTMGYAENSDIGWANYTNRGWTVPHVVSYMESHDEERLAFKNKQFGATSGPYSVKELQNSMARIKAASVIFYCVPGPKMLWQFGELGYDYSINTCDDGTINESCRVSNKPVRWDYQSDYLRADLLDHTGDLINLHTSYSVFTRGLATVTSGASLINQVTVKNSPYKENPANTDEMNVQAVANFNLTKQTVAVSFPHTGVWFDYYAGGAPVNVTTTPFNVELKAGAYKLYTDVSIGGGHVMDIVERVDKNGFFGVPNPTNGQFRISTGNRNMFFTLLDSRGVKQQLVLEGEEFNIGHLPHGMYILIGERPSGERNFTKIVKY